jgi:hypothetical protein
MTTTMVTSDALELLLRLNETTKDLLLAVKTLHQDVEDFKLQTIKSPLKTPKEAAEYIKMSTQYLAKEPNGKGTPPPNCMEIYGPNGSGEKPRILYEVKELDRWIADAKRRYSTESQERRRREHDA